jgi:hypothetical protein
MTNQREQQTWRAKLALECWNRGELKWSELQKELREAGLNEQESEELAAELGL